VEQHIVALTAAKIVAIVRLEQYDRAVEVAQALLAGGITAIEYTLTGSGAFAAIERVRVALGDRMLVGVGTALQPDDAMQAVSAGAQFVVTPAVRPAVIAAASKAGVPTACGALTPTEALTAHEAGAAFIKIFPARTFGPGYIRDILAPLPFLRIMPTGGIGADNVKAYLDAGAVGVGIGGSLVPQKAVQAGDWHVLTAGAQACVSAMKGA
jgi:2-dehydro-3-deoxyphosphogluconate aldolase/(4S)-4-hydroxy-2-oxoglutarate aldolase